MFKLEPPQIGVHARTHIFVDVKKVHVPAYTIWTFFVVLYRESANSIMTPYRTAPACWAYNHAEYLNAGIHALPHSYDLMEGA
jgi:hypothetical protein